MRRKYVPELNCFLRRWIDLGGPSKIPVVIRDENNRGNIVLRRGASGVHFQVERNPRGWLIDPKSASYKFEIKLLKNKPTLVIYGAFSPLLIRDYWR